MNKIKLIIFITIILSKNLLVAEELKWDCFINDGAYDGILSKSNLTNPLMTYKQIVENSKKVSGGGLKLLTEINNRKLYILKFKIKNH